MKSLFYAFCNGQSHYCCYTNSTIVISIPLCFFPFHGFAFQTLLSYNNKVYLIIFAVQILAYIMRQALFDIYLMQPCTLYPKYEFHYNWLFSNYPFDTKCSLWYDMEFDLGWMIKGMILWLGIEIYKWKVVFTLR